MKFDELEKFILYDMKMDASTGETKNSQPVMILTLLRNNGVATKDNIQKELHNYNQGYHERFFDNCEVFNVLTKSHPITTYNENEDSYLLSDYDTYTEEQKQRIIQLCEEKIQEASEIRKRSTESNVWLWSVTPENWEIVKRKNVWASIRENIRNRVHKYDKIIFYVKETGQFQGIFEIISDWYNATEPVWSDEHDVVKFSLQVKLKPLRLGNVNVYDIASRLKLFSDPADKQKINLVLKGGGGYPSNSGKLVQYDDYLTIFNSMTDVPRNTLVEYYIALGPWSNWDHTIKHPPFRWGIRDSSASNLGVYDALKEGDIVFYYANQDQPTPFSKRGLFGVGRVARKYIENNEKYWPDEQLSNKVIYKHRFEIENLKLVTTDEELLPWVDGLPFTKGLNHIVDQIPLEKLLEHTRKKWKIDLPPFVTTNAVNYWKIAPGKEAENWEFQLNNGIIAIGWNDLGDLTNVSQEELNKRMREKYPKVVAQRYQIEYFLKIKKGDIIIANKGESKVVGIGRVIGDYKYYAALKHTHTYRQLILKLSSTS